MEFVNNSNIDKRAKKYHYREQMFETIVYLFKY